MSHTIWYHGTRSKRRVSSISRTGFRIGTYFARHMEDAVHFGGKYVFRVEVHFHNARGWQVSCANPIPASAITGYFEVVQLHDAM